MFKFYDEFSLKFSIHFIQISIAMKYFTEFKRWEFQELNPLGKMTSQISIGMG